MKTLILGILLLGFTAGAMAIDKVELDNRILTLTEKFAALQQKPDKCVPADILKQARGIILLDRTKAGFIFAYQGGGGIAMVREPGTDKWSPAGFVDANEGSLGLQIGGEQTFFVILLMNTNTTRLLTDPKFDFGGEARGTAGDQSAGQQGTVNPQPAVYVYDDRQGLYAGAAVKGGAVTPDDDANTIYYGQAVTMQDVLFNNRVQRTPSINDLVQRINSFANKRPDK